MVEITLQQALDEFITVYLPARNLAAITMEEYSNDLKAFNVLKIFVNFLTEL